MAREHAVIRLDMWGDDHWRRLTPAAQHLYMLLLTSPTLNFCGVADWRPARIASLAADWTAQDVEATAAELCEELFLVIDAGTEEVLVRSFVRHDGLMKQPNMATAMATDHAAIASTLLRGVVVHELRRLREEHPDLAGWRSTKALDVLTRNAIDPSGNPSVDPSVKGSGNPSVDPNPNPSVDPCPTPAPNSLLLTPTPKGKIGPRKRATPTPEDLPITDPMRAWAAAKNITNLEAETERMLDHHRAKGSTFKDWTAAWRTWMSNSVKFATPRNGQTLTANPGRRLSGSEIDDLIGPDYANRPEPPAGLDVDAQHEWRRQWLLARIEERQQAALAKLGAAS